MTSTASCTPVRLLSVMSWPLESSPNSANTERMIQSTARPIVSSTASISQAAPRRQKPPYTWLGATGGGAWTAYGGGWGGCTAPVVGLRSAAAVAETAGVTIGGGRTGTADDAASGGPGGAGGAGRARARPS